MAIYSFKEFYQKCLKLESINNFKIHKADTLHWIARFYLQLKEMENSFRYSILCFLDDVISEKLETKNSKDEILIGNSLDVPICHLLQFYFQVPQVNIENLKRTAMEILSNNLDILDPEKLVFAMRKKGHQIPRHTDYKYYNPSYVHLEKEYETVRGTDDDKKWEEFAALLFSAVEGFEPILDVKPGYSSYQFDVVIRNLTPDDFTIPWLGEYFAIECKYYQTNSVGTDDINHFAAKLKYHDFKCGIIFTKTPLSGWKSKSGEYAGKLIQTKILNRDGIIIFDLIEKDIEEIINGRNLVEVLIEKYEKVRLEL